MADAIDPQVSAALVTSGGGLITGILGTWAGFWARARRRGGQQERCERICASVVAIAETTMAVIKAIGADDARLVPHIVEMEIRVHEARAFLAESREG